MRIKNNLFDIEAIYDEDNNKIIAQYENPFKNCYTSDDNQLYLESKYDEFFREILEPNVQKTLMLCYFSNVRSIDIRNIK